MSKIRWDDLPEARQLAGLGKKLSRAGQTRLQWMLFYSFNGRNAARTCRHFGISRQTFYRWWRRFDRPLRVRQPTWCPAAAEHLLALRRENSRWGKDKLVVLLRHQSYRLSTSMVGRILTHLKLRGAA